MHDSQIANGRAPTVELGSIRLWDTGTTWREIEKVQDVYDWSTTDRAVTHARAAGYRPLLVLGQTPQFHATNDPPTFEAYGDGATSMPRIAAWKNYVTAAAKQYGVTVDYQIWNEPNVINYWSGTVSQMAKLTATAHAAISKVAGRKATVVAPAFPLRLEGQRTWFKKYWAAKVNRQGMASYVDVVAVNLYPLEDQAPEASMKLLRFAKRALPKAARSKPMWNTEINYGLRGGPAAKEISDAKQAAFVARTLLLNAGSPIRRVFWYSWAQGPIANTHLVEDDRITLTRGGHAWEVARGWLAGTDMRPCKQVARGELKGLYTCTARKGRSEVRRFYWKPSGKAVSIKTVPSTTSWTDLDGDRTARKGSFRINVSQSPVMVTSRK